MTGYQDSSPSNGHQYDALSSVKFGLGTTYNGLILITYLFYLPVFIIFSILFLQQQPFHPKLLAWNYFLFLQFLLMNVLRVACIKYTALSTVMHVFKYCPYKIPELCFGWIVSILTLKQLGIFLQNVIMFSSWQYAYVIFMYETGPMQWIFSQHCEY